jgi:hypothetical protein
MIEISVGTLILLSIGAFLVGMITLLAVVLILVRRWNNGLSGILGRALSWNVDRAPQFLAWSLGLQPFLLPVTNAALRFLLEVCKMLVRCLSSGQDHLMR